MFSRRDPQEEDGGENGRDVFNEKPSVEEVSVLGLTEPETYMGAGMAVNVLSPLAWLGIAGY